MARCGACHALLLVPLLVLVAPVEPSVSASPCTSSSCQRAQATANTLQSVWYNSTTGGWGCGYGTHTDPAAAHPLEARGRSTPTRGGRSLGVGWWNCGNAVEALCNTIVYASAGSNLSAVVRNTWEATAALYPIKVAFDGSNDDKGWWSLAWLRASEALGESKFVSRSKGYFASIGVDWDDKCGGGVWWSSKKGYKNAITNELYLVQASKLYRLTRNATYLEWARKEWEWFERSGMINGKWLVNDGLTSDCQNNGGTTWTYNQGVILGGLVEYYIATGSSNDTLIDVAINIANATIHNLIYPGGILKEPCEDGTGSDPCDADGNQFKGIFMRYLGYLTSFLSTSPSPSPRWKAAATEFSAFAAMNANTMWSSDQNQDGQFGVRWVGPPGSFTSSTLQVSALDCLNTHALLAD